MFSGEDVAAVKRQIVDAGQDPNNYAFYQQGDRVVASTVDSAPPEGAVRISGEETRLEPTQPTTQPLQAEDQEFAGGVRPGEAGLALPPSQPQQVAAGTPDPSQPLGEFSPEFITSMRQYQADKIKRPLRGFFQGIAGVGRSLQGKSSGIMTPAQEQAYRMQLLKLLNDQDSTVNANLRAAGQLNQSQLEALTSILKGAEGTASNIRDREYRRAEEELKEQGRDLRDSIADLSKRQEAEGWSLWSTDIRLRTNTSAKVAAVIEGSGAFQTKTGARGESIDEIIPGQEGKFYQILHEALKGIKDPAERAFFIDELEATATDSGIVLTDEIIIGDTDKFYRRAGPEIRELFRDARIEKKQRERTDERYEKTIDELRAKQRGRVEVLLKDNVEYQKALDTIEQTQTDLRNLEDESKAISYRLVHGSGAMQGQPITEQNWTQATQEAMTSVTQPPTTAAPPPTSPAPAEAAEPPPPQAEPEVEAAPPEAQRVLDGGYEYQQRPDGSIDVFKAGQSEPLIPGGAKPGTEAYDNAKKVIDAQPAPAEPEPAPSPPPAPAVGEGDPPQPSPTAPKDRPPGDSVGRIAVAREGDSPQDVALRLLNDGGNQGKQFQRETMASPMFEKFMRDKGITDPQLGWKAFTSEFRYRSSQQKRMDRRKLDEDIIQDPKKYKGSEVMGARLRTGFRQLFAPKDAAGNVTSRWERSFESKPNPSAVAASETPTDNNLPEEQAKRDEQKQPGN